MDNGIDNDVPPSDDKRKHTSLAYPSSTVRVYQGLPLITNYKLGAYLLQRKAEALWSNNTDFPLCSNSNWDKGTETIATPANDGNPTATQVATPTVTAR